MVNLDDIPVEVFLLIVSKILCTKGDCWDISCIINLLKTLSNTKYETIIKDALKQIQWKHHFLLRDDYLMLKKFIQLKESDVKIAGIIFTNGTVMDFSWENFENNKQNITHVCIPDGVTSITIQYGVTSIGNWAFYGCTSSG